MNRKTRRRRATSPRPPRRSSGPAEADEEPIVEETRDRLGRYSFMHGLDPGGEIEIRASGPKIGPQSADGAVVGAVIQRVTNFLQALGGTPLPFRGLAFEHSISLYYRSSQEEVESATVLFE